jgi:hypothetical protein
VDKPADKPVVATPPPASTATVNRDTDLYNHPEGNIIGHLNEGQVLTLDITKNTTCPANGWCYFVDPTSAAGEET